MDFHFHQIDLEALNDSISDLTVKKIVYFSQIDLNLKKVRVQPINPNSEKITHFYNTFYITYRISHKAWRTRFP